MRFQYWIFRIITKIISWLPYSLLYLISDFLTLVINGLLPYRKKVIFENLHKSFPEKDQNEINQITKEFYRNLIDISLETIKLEVISKEEILKRVSVLGNDLLHQLSVRKKGVVVVMSHNGNWEWVGQRVCIEGLRFDDFGIIAKEMTNPYFEKYFTKLRSRLLEGNGIGEIIPFNETARRLASKRHKACMIVAIADQTPHHDQIQYRTNFLNQESGVFLGPERIAKSLDYAVVFCHVRRTGRGYYQISFELITESPTKTEPYFITDQHVKMLEEDIISQPELWLWSHRRWKYQ